MTAVTKAVSPSAGEGFPKIYAATSVPAMANEPAWLAGSLWPMRVSLSLACRALAVPLRAALWVDDRLYPPQRPQRRPMAAIRWPDDAGRTDRVRDEAPPGPVRARVRRRA